MTRYLGFDIGGTKCAVVLGEVAADGARVVASQSFATRDTVGPEPTLARLVALSRELLARHDWRLAEVAALGISCGGPLDFRRGVVLSPPNLPGWDEVPLVAQCQERLGLPTRLMNDANAGALAEWQFGAGRGVDNLIFLTYGTGMGAGLICNGQLYEGANGYAGEVGHLRLTPTGPVGFHKAGSFEGWCSGGGIGRQAQDLARQHGGQVAFNPGQIDDISARTVVAAAEAGDPLAQALLAESARHLGQALALLVDVLNPELIVLGSFFVRARRWLEPHLHPALRAEALDLALAVCRVVPASLGDEIGNWAAIAIAQEHHRGLTTPLARA